MTGCRPFEIRPFTSLIALTRFGLTFDVRHLVAHGGNASYALAEYDLLVHPDPHANLPETLQYGSALPGQNAEFCIGYCIFGAPGVMTLRFSDGLEQLQLGWMATGNLSE
ncbi:MAG: hypothetical protein E6K65_00255 [Nitrospirae bacterium]|nr:MAG: hypothetical protein E6K65_00255 [Nitrospirota bacterium]